MGERIDQFVGCGLEIVRFVARDTEFHPVREDIPAVVAAVRALGRECDAVGVLELAPVRGDAHPEQIAFRIRFKAV